MKAGVNTNDSQQLQATALNTLQHFNLDPNCAHTQLVEPTLRKGKA